MTTAAEHQTHPLFSVQERWGWQYVPAVTPQMSPVAEARPEWVEPPTPKITHLERQLSDTGQRLMQAVLSGTLFVVFGLVAFLLLGGTPIVGAALITIGVVVYGHRFLRVHRARQALRRIKLQRAEDRESRWDDHQRRLRAWEEAVGRHAAEEQLRFASQPLWFPVLPGVSRRRVDVCGGTVTSADVVDALALSIREPTGEVDDQQAETHALDSEVLELAISCLDAPYSVARLVAALTFLARPHDADAVARLAAQELQRLAANTDTVVTDTELRRRLSVILARLRPLRDMVLDDEPPALVRLGNTDEASAAAEYVGKEHKLVLSQVTHSVGETLTDTAGTSDTWQEGISDTSSTSRGTTTNDGLISRTSRNTGTSEGVSTSRSYAWGQTRSLAQAVTAQSGQTMARSYEFTVEPTRFQSLPSTAFIAVARNGYENMVVAADCNPGIVDLDRVASAPYGP